MYLSTNAAANGDHDTTRRSTVGAIVCVVAAALGAAVYVNALNNPFIYDDYRLVVENRSLSATNPLALFWYDVSRPIVNASFAVDRALWGAGPFGFHLTSVLLHTLNVALVALLTWRFAQPSSTAAVPHRLPVRPDVAAPVAALLFAVHPMMSQAVGYISGRSELLCASFFLLGVLSARRWMLQPRPWQLAATFACWLLALGSREVAVMFPVVVLALDRWLVDGSPAERRRRLLHLHGPLMVTACLLGAGRLAVLTFVEHPGSVAFDGRLGLAALESIYLYLTQLIRPTSQTIFHFVPAIEHFLDPRALRGVATIGGLLAFAWVVRRRVPIVALGLAWFPALLVPSAMLVVLDRAEPMAEHRIYLASVGLFAAIGGSAAVTWNRLARRTRLVRGLAIACGLLFLTTLAGRTVMRNDLWSDPASVWREAAARAPDHWLPRLGLAEELHRAGRHEEAITLFRQVTAAVPDEPAGYAKLAVCLAETGDLDHAADAFTTLQRLVPRSVEATNGLSMIRLLRGDADAARRGYLEALTLDHMNLAARRGLAAVARLEHNSQDATRWCAEIRHLAPDAPDDDACRHDVNRTR
jgi:hypothetical protein